MQFSAGSFPQADIHTINLEAHVPDSDVRVERRFDAEEARQLFVDRLGIAAKV